MKRTTTTGAFTHIKCMIVELNSESLFVFIFFPVHIVLNERVFAKRIFLVLGFSHAFSWCWYVSSFFVGFLFLSLAPFSILFSICSNERSRWQECICTCKQMKQAWNIFNFRPFFPAIQPGETDNVTLSVQQLRRIKRDHAFSNLFAVWAFMSYVTIYFQIYSMAVHSLFPFSPSNMHLFSTIYIHADGKRRFFSLWNMQKANRKLLLCALQHKKQSNENVWNCFYFVFEHGTSLAFMEL